MFEMLSQGSVFAKATMAVSMGACIVAATYAFRPTERRLAFMRPLSLAAIFATLSGLAGGAAIVLRDIAATPAATLDMSRVYMGLAETFMFVFVPFGFLAAAWLLVLAGMLRRVP